MRPEGPPHKTVPTHALIAIQKESPTDNDLVPYLCKKPCRRPPVTPPIPRIEQASGQRNKANSLVSQYTMNCLHIIFQNKFTNIPLLILLLVKNYLDKKGDFLP